MSDAPEPKIESALAELDEPGPRPGPRGCVDVALERHPDQADLILGGVNHDRASARTVSRWLEKHGITGLSGQTIARHRRKECTCQNR